MAKDTRRIFNGWPTGNGKKNEDGSNPFHEDSAASKGAAAGTELVGYGKSNEGLRLIIHNLNGSENGQVTGKITILNAGWPNEHNSRLSEILNEPLTVSEIKTKLDLKSTMAFLKKVLIPVDSLSEEIQQALDDISSINVDEDALTELNAETPATENLRELKLHLARERNTAKAREAKAKYRANTIPPVCQACEELFEDKYDLPYLEAHHKDPLSADDEVRDTTTDDFDLLCANCHKAIHRMPEGSVLEDLKAVLRKNGCIN